MKLLPVVLALIGTVASAQQPSWYHRQDSWQETVRVSAESFMQLESAANRLEKALFGPWHVIGPFTSTLRTPFVEKFPPEKEINFSRHYGPLKWMVRKDWQSGKVIDLLPATWCATYLARDVRAERETTLTLYLGSDDGIKVWMNGAIVLEDNASRGCAPNQDTAHIRLRKGRNTLLLKITNGEGPTAFYFSLLGPNREGIWEHVQHDFPRAETLLEISWERADSIYDMEWQPGDLSALGRRYWNAYARTALENDSPVKGEPPVVRTVSDLEKVRRLYLDERRKEYEDIAHLTPKEGPAPRINGPAVFGVRPGHPFLYRIPATGNRPMMFDVHGLPAGLTLDSTTGQITGAIDRRGEYKVVFKATNALGSAFKDFAIEVGDRIALTPPLGWNSWNCFASAVDESKVLSAAEAMVKSGLANHGWTYINIDDCWMVRPGSNDSLTRGVPRKANGRINTNAKFPDMPALSRAIHDRGLKLGIYSSPGPLTCAGYTGSYQHELDDARQYAEWGIDYLKYDWCSYGDINRDTSLAGYERPYRVMRAALDSVDRDIVYSLCQYGMKNVWTWGDALGGNCWRTTGDIEDTWKSMSGIGFAQNGHEPYAGPGHWNDPDMLVVGWVGWGPQLHPTRLTPEEQLTHITLWSLLAAPMLIGCDMTRLDDLTYGLLSNDEVLEINQDQLGVQGRRVMRNKDTEIWVKPLSDGSLAVGLFNRGPQKTAIVVDWRELGLAGSCRVRDVWRQEDLGKFEGSYSVRVGRHSAALIKVSEAH
ncbi:MAG: putative Ig domain-containing protein [Bacteroidota bacterium]